MLPDWASEALQLSPDDTGSGRWSDCAALTANWRCTWSTTCLTSTRPSCRRSGRTSTASLYWTLREQCGVEVAGSSRMLEAVSAPPPLARRLGVPSRYPARLHSVSHKGRHRQAHRLLSGLVAHRPATNRRRDRHMGVIGRPRRQSLLCRSAQRRCRSRQRLRLTASSFRGPLTLNLYRQVASLVATRRGDPWGTSHSL